MADSITFDYDQQAPLDVETVSVRRRDDGVEVRDMTYASPKGGRVPAYLIVPAGTGPFAGIIFVHWGEGNREEFVAEAVSLAGLGAVSLCIDSPHARPERLRSSAYDPRESPHEAEIQLITDVRRGVDVLAARPDVDARRIGYVGHSYGATFGGVLAAVEKRIKAYVLMAGCASLTNSYRTSTNPMIAQARATTLPAVWERFLSLMEPLNAEHYIGHAAPAILFFQFARQDESVTEQEALSYARAASEPKLTKWYGCGHAFNAEARWDRARWLQEELGLGPIAAAQIERGEL